MNRRRIWAVVRTLIGLSLLVWLLRSLDPSAVVGSLRDADWRWGAGALAAQILAKFVWTARWKKILEIGGVRRRFWDLMALVHMGLFFNSFLPTSVGGDLVRGFYTSGPDGKTASFASLVVERALGFVAMVAVGGVAAAMMLGESSPPFPRVWLAAIAAGAAVVTVLSLLLPRIELGALIARRLEARGGRAAKLAGPLTAASALFRAGAASPQVVGWSIALQIVAVLFHVACARAVGLDVPALDFFLIVPASVVASMAPVSLNGLGIREGVLVALTTFRGAEGPEAGGFAILALLLSTVFAAIGGLLYAGGMLGRIGGRRVTTGS